jgi:serine/threonine-protein kinase
VQIVIGKAKQNEQVAVPNINGQTLKDAQRMLQEAGLAVGNIAGSQDPNSRVFGSNPPQGTQVQKGTAVSLFTADQGGNNGGNGGGGIFGGLTGGRGDD